jgi:hypothetical protein
MTLEELRALVKSQIQEILAEAAEYDTEEPLQEKSVPEPYDRKNRRRMTKAQIRKRDKVGKAMEKNEKTVARFREKHGDDWRSYLWAAASGIVLRRGKKK